MAPRAALLAPVTPLGAGALEGLYEAHAPELRRRCMRLTRDGHAADDLMQEVFVRFITRFPEPPSGMNVGAYLHATARNVLWKQLRDSHEVSDGDIETTVGADDDLENDPERSALLGEQQGLVRRCAAVLTGRQRRALTMRDVEGRSYGEIGSELGIGTGAVMQVISRARARLRVAVRRANVDVDNLAPECVAMLGPLSDYLDGRAAADEQGVEEHLATCDTCCHTLATYQEAGSRSRGYLPLVPLGGILARFHGKLRSVTGSSRAHPGAASTTAPGRAIARIGNALGRSGDGPLGVTGVGALVSAAVIAVVGGSVVVAQHVTAGSARDTSSRPPKRPDACEHRGAHPFPRRRARRSAALGACQPYAGSLNSPTARPATPSASATPAPHLAPRIPLATAPIAPTTPAQPTPSEPATGGRVAAPPKMAPAVTKPVGKKPVAKTPAIKAPAITAPVVRTPIRTPSSPSPSRPRPSTRPSRRRPSQSHPCRRRQCRRLR